ncbi:MAG TPA: alpha/beta hydrolase [Methylomirabilota bacterium]|jgi:pimeloyl-ACP methyl ester carboxylesterase|nr:alpha/beta hydrolase [Methylomirabilota bacterium]
MSFLERTAKVNGITLHYLDWGPADAPPVVLLHGITGHARVWDHLAARLVPGRRMLALDQRGHGDSDPAPDDDYRVGTMADDVAAFVGSLRIDRLALLGHSMGGRIAIKYAADHAARLERLVIVDIGPDINLAGLERVRDMMAQSPERIESEDWAVEYIRRANPLQDLDMLRERVRHGLKRLPDGELTWKYAKGLRDMMREGRRDAVDLWEPLPRIPCPTLVVRGAESDILSAEVAKKMTERLPDGRVVEIAGAGHTVPADRPEEFVRQIRAFLGA